MARNRAVVASFPFAETLKEREDGPTAEDGLQLQAQGREKLQLDEVRKAFLGRNNRMFKGRNWVGRERESERETERQRDSQAQKMAGGKSSSVKLPGAHDATAKHGEVGNETGKLMLGLDY
jgi:hypothetical protein